MFCCCLSQRFNADYELTARQGADTMAYTALLEEKLRPALVGRSLCVGLDIIVGTRRRLSSLGILNGTEL